MSVALATTFTISASTTIEAPDGFVKADRTQLKVGDDALKTIRESAADRRAIIRPKATDGASAYYSRPAGALFNGFSKQLGLLQDYYVLTAPYSDAVWTNKSTNADTFEWVFNGETTTDLNLTTNMPFGLYPLPQLTAKGDGSMGVYTFPDASQVQYGGTFAYKDGSDYVSAGLGNWRIAKKYTSWGFGRDAYADWLWTVIFGSANNETWVIDQVGNFFEKPVSPYVFSEMWVNCVTECTADAEFVMSLYYVSDDGEIDGFPFATGRCAGSDVLSFDISGGMVEDSSYEIIPFKFYRTVDGEEEELSNIVIDRAFIAFISGFSDTSKVVYYDTFTQYEPNEDGECNIYLNFDITKADGTHYSRLLPSSVITNGTPLYLSACFNMDAVYPWLVGTDAEFDAAVEGESKTFCLSSYYDAAQLTVEGAGDWLAVQVDDATLDADGDGKDEKCVKITVTAEALPDGKTSRKSDLKITAPAVEWSIAVKQGDAGIAAAKSACSAGVAIKGGRIVVTLDAADEVTIYDAAGRLVQQATLGEGSNEIAASHLDAGLYILRFASHGVAKVVK